MEYEYGGRLAKDLQRAADCYRELLERDSFSFSDARSRLEKINAELNKSYLTEIKRVLQSVYRL